MRKELEEKDLGDITSEEYEEMKDLERDWEDLYKYSDPEKYE